MSYDLFDQTESTEDLVSSETVSEVETSSMTFDLAADVLEADAQEVAAEVWDYDADPTARYMDQGINVSFYSSQGARDHVIFINQAKSAVAWTVYGKDATYEMDDNGYVSSLSEGAYATSELLRRNPDLDGLGPFFGEFRVYGQGEGTIKLTSSHAGTLVSNTDTSTLGREVIDGVEYWYVDLDFEAIQSDNGKLPKLYLNILATDSDNYIHDIALIHHSHLDEFRAGDMYAPEFIDDLTPYTTLRFMDWMAANHIQQVDKYDYHVEDPDARYIGLDQFTYANRAGGKGFVTSVAIEAIVELANETDSNPWINLPVDILDARVIEMAEYVRDNLEDGLEVYWEYGNELWNGAWGFDSFRYAAMMAQETFGIEGTNPMVTAEWSAYRGPQIYDIIDELYGDQGEELHFVAGGFAYDGPVKDNGSFSSGSYSFRYFQANEAQKMEDAPSRPEDIITDYALGMYYGSLKPSSSEEVAAWIVETFEDGHEQAEIMARWMLFGNNADTFYDLANSVLSNPVTDVEWRDDLNIAVSKLIFSDVQAGLDPLRDLDQVIRLAGTELQYRALGDTDWTTILTFTDVPPKTLEDMILDVQLIGQSYRMDGEVRSGVVSSVANAADMRIDAHRAFVEALGLNFVSYEGGNSLAYYPEGGLEMYTAYVQDGWAAVISNAFYDRGEAAGMDLFMKFKSHDQYAMVDRWGAQQYTGQSLDETPEGKLLVESIALGDPDTPEYVAEPYDPNWADRAVAPLYVDYAQSNWDVSGEEDDLTFVETEASTLELSLRHGVRSGESYTLDFDIESDVENPGTLKVYVQAAGNGSNTLLNTEIDITDGTHVSLDLGEIPAPRNMLRITIRRGGGSEGELTIANLDVLDVNAPVPTEDPITDEEPATAEDPATDEEPVVDEEPTTTEDPVVDEEPTTTEEPTPTPEPTEEGSLDLLTPQEADFAQSWTVNGVWELDPTAASATAQETGTGYLTLSIPAVAGTLGGKLSFDIASGSDAPGKLVVYVQAAGNGSTELALWKQDVTDGQHVEIDLKDIPEPHDRLRIQIRRGGTQDGDLTISNFALTAETVPGYEAPEEPVPAITNVADLTWKTYGGWDLDPVDGTATIAAGNSEALTLTTPVAPSSQNTLAFTVNTDAADAGELRVYVYATGGGRTSIGFWKDLHITDGQQVIIELGDVPANRDTLTISISRASNQDGDLTIGNVAVYPVEAPVVSDFLNDTLVFA